MVVWRIRVRALEQWAIAQGKDLERLAAAPAQVLGRLRRDGQGVVRGRCVEQDVVEADVELGSGLVLEAQADPVQFIRHGVQRCLGVDGGPGRVSRSRWRSRPLAGPGSGCCQEYTAILPQAFCAIFESTNSRPG